MTTTTLTRADIIDSLVREINFPRHQATDFLEAALNDMMASLTDTGLVKISSFGSFKVRQKSKRLGRNPKRGRKPSLHRGACFLLNRLNILERKFKGGKLR